MATPAPSVQKAQVSLVYVARCLVNGKQYVGVTSRGLRERKSCAFPTTHTQIQMQYPDETQM
jgi:hypothetical protein